VDCCSPTLLADAPTLDAMFYFTTGLLMSLGHCTGMCGPLVTAYAVAQCGSCPSGTKLGTGGLLGSFSVYHLGRITSYALIGLVLGLLGSSSQLAGNQTVQAVVALTVGALMLVLALGLAGWLPMNKRLESGRLTTLVIGRMRGLLSATRPQHRFLVGMGNGLLPCGPVYVMAMGTLAAASPWLGAGAMALFGLGTLPVLIVLGLGAGRIGPTLQKRFNHLGVVVVLLLAMQLGLRGAAALGWVGHWRIGEVVIW